MQLFFCLKKGTLVYSFFGKQILLFYVYYKQLHSDNCVVNNNLAVSKCNDNVFQLC